MDTITSSPLTDEYLSMCVLILFSSSWRLKNKWSSSFTNNVITVNKSEAEFSPDSIKWSEIFPMRTMSDLSTEARINVSTENYYFGECKEKQCSSINIWKYQSSIIDLPPALICILCDLGPFTLPLWDSVFIYKMAMIIIIPSKRVIERIKPDKLLTGHLREHGKCSNKC